MSGRQTVETWYLMISTNEAKSTCNSTQNPYAHQLRASEINDLAILISRKVTSSSSSWLAQVTFLKTATWSSAQ